MTIDRCATWENHSRYAHEDAEYRRRARQIELGIKDWFVRYRTAALRIGVIRIPVVVHVIYNSANPTAAAAENIPDAQIHSQMAVLNADFRRLNADAGSTPAAFAGVAADARIEFALATRDPNCNLTPGITRTPTSVAGWSFNDEGMKATPPAGAGGHDPWDVTRYLNIWVVNYADGTLGYGTRPANPDRIQGVTCHYKAFGTTGILLPSANLGRVTTHEVGHWLDLIHVWGGRSADESCTDSDEVADTPNQFKKSSGCPTFPRVSCSNAPDGDMFMNFMDYTDDRCMNLFTADQVTRMHAALHIARASILGSDGLVSPPAAPGADLWMQDVADDVGAEPDASTRPMYISDDIWVRRSNDGTANQDHENPLYRPSGPPNYVYVRVRNRGCTGTGTGTLKLYWAKASSGLGWPSPWDGSVTAPAVMGRMIGSQSVSVSARDYKIYEFPWLPPNPADYAAIGGDKSHFCLLARIETSATAPYGMTFPETANLAANVRNNNNIVWKNIHVTDPSGWGARLASVLVANFRRETERATLQFLVPEQERPSLLDWGQVFVDLPPSLLERAGDVGHDGLRRVDGNTFELLKPRATLRTFELARGEMHPVTIRFVPGERRRPFGVHVLPLDLLQESDGRVIGGQRFIVRTAPDLQRIAIDNPEKVFDGVSWVPREG